MKKCKWHSVCPIHFFTDEGKLDKKWEKNYCLVGNKECVRYQMEENGEYHSDSMLPDGTIKEDLQ